MTVDPAGDAVSYWYWLGLGMLAVWRATHLLHVEYGPWGLLAWSRAKASRFGLGDLMACFYCLSFWTAAPVAWWLVSSWQGRFIAWFALSAGAIFIEVRVMGAPQESYGEEERSNGLLR